MEGIANDGFDQVEGPQSNLSISLDPVTKIISEFRLKDSGAFRLRAIL